MSWRPLLCLQPSISLHGRFPSAAAAAKSRFSVGPRPFSPLNDDDYYSSVVGGAVRL